MKKAPAAAVTYLSGSANQSLVPHAAAKTHIGRTASVRRGHEEAAVVDSRREHAVCRQANNTKSNAQCPAMCFTFTCVFYKSPLTSTTRDLSLAIPISNPRTSILGPGRGHTRTLRNSQLAHIGLGLRSAGRRPPAVRGTQRHEAGQLPGAAGAAGPAAAAAAARCCCCCCCCLLLLAAAAEKPGLSSTEQIGWGS